MPAIEVVAVVRMAVTAVVEAEGHVARWWRRRSVTRVAAVAAMRVLVAGTTNLSCLLNCRGHFAGSGSGFFEAPPQRAMPQQD